jgi:hypothetical protein
MRRSADRLGRLYVDQRLEHHLDDPADHVDVAASADRLQQLDKVIMDEATVSSPSRELCRSTPRITRWPTSVVDPSVTPLEGTPTLAAAGCVGTKPPPPPRPARATQICGQAFTNPDWYRIAYYNLAHANAGWVTAAGFVPVDLQDRRTAWWLSDTMTGTANPDNSVSNIGNVHNSVVLQGGSCLTGNSGTPR